MSLATCQAGLPQYSFPRVSGDEPAGPKRDPKELPFSPRERG